MNRKTSDASVPTLAREFTVKDWGVVRAGFLPDSRHLLVMAPHHDYALIEIGTWNSKAVPRCLFSPERLVGSSDGASFIVTSFNCEPLRCFETETSSVRWALAPGSMDAEFSPDARLVAATRGKSVLLCDAKDGRILHSMKGHKSRVDHVRFSADGQRVASAAQSQVCLWDAASGALVRMVQEKQGEVPGLTLSGDGRVLAAATLKGVVSVYDTAAGEKQCEWAAAESLRHIWLSADGKRLLDYYGAYRLWELPECRLVYQTPAKSLCEFTSDRRALVVLAEGRIQLRDLNGQLLNQVPWEKDPTQHAFAVSPDRKWMACSLDEKVTLWHIGGIL